MKKLISIFTMLALVVTSAVTLVGCSKEKYNFDSTGITNNGNIAVVKDNFVYYINGGLDSTETVSSENKSAICKKALDENGNPTGDEILVFDVNAGVKTSSLYCFGEYLYFTTPSRKLDSTGENMTDYTSFSRVKIDGTDFSELYMSNTTEATFSYAYYKIDNETLKLMLFEESKLYAIDINNDVVETLVKEEVETVLFSENNGQASETDKYAYYTMKPAKDAVNQEGFEVYKYDLKENKSECISTGKNIKLLQIKYGYIYYTIDDKIIYRSTVTSGITMANAVSYKVYNDMFFTSDGGLIVSDSRSEDDKQEFKYTYYYNWSSGTLVQKQLSTKTFGFAFENGDYIYVIDADSKLAKLDKTITNQTPTSITEATITIGDYLNYEVVGNTLIYLTESVVTDEEGTGTKSYITNFMTI